MAFEITTLLTELAGGRRPLWRKQIAVVPGPPWDASAGTALDVGGGKSALVTAARVRLREDVQHRKGYLTPVYDNGATYTFALSGLTGTPVSYTAGPAETEEDVVDGLIAALGAEPNHDAVLLGTRQGSGSSSVLVLRGKAVADWIVATLSASGGGGGEALTAVLDPNHAIGYLWGLSAGAMKVSSDPTDPLEVWGRPFADDDPASSSVRQGSLYFDWQGWADTFNTGTVSRLYLEIDQVNGPTGELVSADLGYRDPEIWFGPCFRESAEPGV